MGGSMILTPEQKTAVAAYLTECRFRTFQLGEWDCALFVADVLLRITGKDLGEGLRGTYDTRDGYLERLPVPLRGLPSHFGMIPASPADGAVWWLPSIVNEGALGIVWQGKLLQPGRRGLHTVTTPFENLKTYQFPWQQ